MSKKRRIDTLRAGIFLLASVFIFTAAIFLVGKKSALFTRTTTLFANFDDISGLAVGAPVRLAGLEVGTVAALSFPSDLGRRQTRVRMVVQSQYMPRIRANSRAFIDSNGLLGDKIVNLSLGDANATPLSEGATLQAGKTLSLEGLTTTMNKALSAAANVTETVDRLVQDRRTNQLGDDLTHSAGSLSRILSQIESGPGLAHELLYEPRYAESVSSILADTRGTVEQAKRSMARVDAVLAQVERGDGTLHALVYGQDGKRVLTELASAAQEIDAVMHELRDGHGVLHSLVYDDDRGRFLADLNQLSATLNQIVQDVDKGRGTIGALVRDPTVYEDLKTVLGNVKRNVLFKALVRYTMEEDQLRRVK